MCGRYALYAKLAQIAAYFKAKEGSDGLWDWEPSYNIAPSTVVPVIARDGKRERKIVPMRWGLHPNWKKEPPQGRPIFNARVETAAEKPSFRTPFRRRRALIPANGWFEWEGVETPKTPHYIKEKGRDLYAFAGLWDRWRVEEGVTLLSATILTTAATGPVKHLHHRMPVRLPEERWEDWLNWDERPERVLEDMKDGHGLEFHAVSRAVSSGRASGAELVASV